MQKRIIVDIDNTLWDFGSVLWEYLKGINASTPEPTAWCKWDFWMDYVTEKEFYKVVREIHINQNHQNFSPYAEARSSCRVPRVKLNSCYEENQCGHPFKGHLSRGKSYPKARKRIFSRQYL